MGATKVRDAIYISISPHTPGVCNHLLDGYQKSPKCLIGSTPRHTSSTLADKRLVIFYINMLNLVPIFFSESIHNIDIQPFLAHFCCSYSMIIFATTVKL